MKECILVYFDAVVDRMELDEAIVKMDYLLLENGWKYSGFRNIYVPISWECFDIICDDVVNLIENTEWLKKYNPRVEVLTQTNACSIKDIHVGAMSFPDRKKLKRYKDYYAKKRKFAHPIVVDENNNLRDGYTTYIIANEEGVNAEIVRIDSFVKYKKVVIGRHVVFDGENYIVCSDKAYRWTCNLDAAVVPGDVLLANTRIGKRYMLVERITYVTGDEYAEDKSIKKFVAVS